MPKTDNLTPLARYNRAYRNSQYRDVQSAARKAALDEDEYTLIMNTLIDASLEVCGSRFYHHSRVMFTAMLDAISDPALTWRGHAYLRSLYARAYASAPI